MHDITTFYNIFGLIRDQVMAELEENVDYKEANSDILHLVDSIRNSVSETVDNKLIKLEEKEVRRSGVVEEAMYLKGFQDGINLLMFVTKGDIVRNYNKLTNEKLHLSEN